MARPEILDCGLGAIDASSWTIGAIRADADGAIVAMNESALETLGRLGLRRAPRTLADIRGADPSGGDERLLRARCGALIKLKIMREPTGAMTALIFEDEAATRAMLEAERAQKKFSALADWAPRSAVYTLDRAGCVATWSRSAERFEGMSAERAIGQSFATLLREAEFSIDGDALLAGAAEAGTVEHAGWRRAYGGAAHWTGVTVRLLRRGGAVDGFLVVFRDLTAATGREAELRRLAETDPLTNVLNRRGFFTAARAAREMIARDGVERFALVAFDLDGFKTINDTRGHVIGDAALVTLAGSVRDTLRGGDLIGRLGGDEFAIALPSLDAAQACAAAERIRRHVAKLEITQDGAPFAISASFGVAVPLSPGEPLEQILTRADEALYAAKRAGRNRVVTC